MGRVKQRDTHPEMIVRRALRGLGYRYRLQGKDLPGKPDIVLPRHKKVVFVHGCFWHGHPGCKRASRPSSNQEFWNTKLSRNIERDCENLKELEGLGWTPLVVWECEAKKPEILEAKLKEFFKSE